MTLRFSYGRFAAPAPLWALQGRPDRPRPVIHVALIGPSQTRVRLSLLDTGADDTVFPEDLASQVGVDLTGAPTATASGVGVVGASLRYAEVDLRLSDGREFRQWRARVGFTSAPLKRPLLGFAGFLQFFTATFCGDREEVELAVNTLYHGT